MTNLETEGDEDRKSDDLLGYPIYDPTARGDAVAEKMRQYYEAHRESWWDRIWKRWRYTNDGLMLGLAGEAYRWGVAYTPSALAEDVELIARLRRLVDDQTGGDALVLVQRQLFNKVVGRLAALSTLSKRPEGER